MLSIGRVGPANAGYYQSAVVAGAEDCYAGDGDAPGVWVGRADLVGAVAGSLATAVDAKLLLEAKCGPDGTRLGKTTVSERSVTAFDLTFSVPKSVSVLYALGDDRVAAEIEAAHAVAVEEAIKSMSPRIAFTRTGRAGAAVVDAEEVFGIRYRHRTSRALDPQLHDHVLIANAVRTVSDGEWRTLMPEVCSARRRPLAPCFRQVCNTISAYSDHSSYHSNPDVLLPVLATISTDVCAAVERNVGHGVRRRWYRWRKTLAVVAIVCLIARVAVDEFWEFVGFGMVVATFVAWSRVELGWRLRYRRQVRPYDDGLFARWLSDSRAPASYPTLVSSMVVGVVVSTIVGSTPPATIRLGTAIGVTAGIGNRGVLLGSVGAFVITVTLYLVARRTLRRFGAQ